MTDLLGNSDEIGMRFYVSDAHFKESCSNGSCCGLPESFNYSRGQWCQALMLAKKNGKVTYSEVKDDIEKFYVKNSQFGKYTVSKGGKISAVGSYRNNCGGADTIQKDDLYYLLIDYLIENFGGDVIVEGLMSRGFEKILSLFENVSDKNFSVNLIKLNLPLEVCVGRVKNRTGKIPNVKSMESKMKSFNCFFEKFVSLKNLFL